MTLRPIHLAASLALGLALSAAPAFAALKVGAKAPLFQAPAALDGKPFTFSLADALKKGPVVLYFYPKAFTSGCSAEAHAFAEATDRFKAAGATVIGISHDDLATLQDFSKKDCASRFAVASDAEGKEIKAYDVALGLPLSAIPMLAGASNRTSFVIAPDGTILYAMTDNKPDAHVTNTLQAVQDWRAKHKA